jgi:hypothetical protein
MKVLLLLILCFVLLSTWSSQNQQHTRTIQAPRTRSAKLTSSRQAGLIIGGPSLSAAFVDQVLAAVHSPAQGIGPTLSQLSLRYHLDDAYALAFFHHESDYGTKGVAAHTHSWGNIRCTSGWICDPSGGYRAYPTYAAAAQDWYHLLATVYVARGLTTVSSIIPVYAPGGDHNDEAAYIQSVLSDVTTYRKGRVVA